MERRDDGMFDSFVTQVVRAAVDGIGPFKGARELVDPHRRRGLSTSAVVDRVVRTQVTQAAAQGALSGLGGLVTMLAGLAPATAASMFVQARLSAAIAHAHGHDLDDPLVRDRIGRLVTGSSVSTGVQKAGREAGERAAKALVPRVQAKAASRSGRADGGGQGGRTDRHPGRRHLRRQGDPGGRCRRGRRGRPRDHPPGGREGAPGVRSAPPPGVVPLTRRRRPAAGWSWPPAWRWRRRSPRPCRRPRRTPGSPRPRSARPPPCRARRTPAPRPS